MSSERERAERSETSELEPASVPAEEQSLGRYRLLYELAAGGMATVYLARRDDEQRFGRLCALKLIHRHLARDRRFIEMFLDEARIASLINHPNVCRVFDFGEASGSYYIAMEYLVGEPFSSVLRKLEIDPDLARRPGTHHLAAKLVAEACEGLHAAHELEENGVGLGVVHRDVSPQNLFVCYDGTVRVVDFGVAKAAGRIQETKSGELKGKLAYMAPEQIRRKPLDRRADVWALGVVLWEMLTVQRLFKRPDELDTLIAIAEDPIDPPSARAPGVPEALDAIVLRALARDPAARYATARELGRELHRFLVSEAAVVGTAEVADWMSAVFPERRDRHSGILRSVGWNAEAPTLLLEPSRSGIHAAETAPLDAPAEPAPPRRAPRRAPWLALVFVALLASGLGVLGTVIVVAVSSDEDPTARTEEPATAEPPVAAPRTTAAEATTIESAAAAPIVAAPIVAAPVEPEPAVVSRAARARDESAEPAGRGQVTVVTTGGWASIARGGQPLGNTPREITLPAGRHVLTLRESGSGPPITKVVRVRAGEHHRVVVPLR